MSPMSQTFPRCRAGQTMHPDHPAANPGHPPKPPTCRHADTAPPIDRWSSILQFERRLRPSARGRPDEHIDIGGPTMIRSPRKNGRTSRRNSRPITRRLPTEGARRQPLPRNLLRLDMKAFAPPTLRSGLSRPAQPDVPSPFAQQADDCATAKSASEGDLYGTRGAGLRARSNCKQGAILQQPGD